jgi:hypothetical protein
MVSTYLPWWTPSLPLRRQDSRTGWPDAYGVALPKVNGRYTVSDDEGRAVPVWVKRNLFDPVPRLKIDDKIVCLARPLTWYEYVWLGFPMAILLLGGPGLLVVGYPAAVFSSQILRSNRGAFSRYALTGLVSVATLGLVLLAALALGLILNAIP